MPLKQMAGSRSGPWANFLVFNIEMVSALKAVRDIVSKFGTKFYKQISEDVQILIEL